MHRRVWIFWISVRIGLSAIRADCGIIVVVFFMAFWTSPTHFSIVLSFISRANAQLFFDCVIQYRRLFCARSVRIQGSFDHPAFCFGNENWTSWYCTAGRIDWRNAQSSPACLLPLTVSLQALLFLSRTFFEAWISKAGSATIRFRRLFSSSRARSLFNYKLVFNHKLA